MEKKTVQLNYDEFDSSFYLKRRFSDPEDKERGVQPFYLQSIHDFYQKFHSQWNHSTARLLEYGGGPVIYPLISASPFVSEITFSDYADGSIKEVMLWKDKDPSAHNWTPYFQYVIGTLEGNTNDSVVVEREEDLRGKLKYFFKGDLLKPEILNLPLDFSPPLFDIISCNFCLEVVAKSIDHYRKLLTKLTNLLKPGGFLCSLVSIEESWYMNGSAQQYGLLYLTTNDVDSAYKSVGLSVLQTAYQNVPAKAQNIFNDCKANYFIATQKNIN